MNALLDTFADSLGYLLVIAVLFAFPLGIGIYTAYEVIEQFARSDERQKPVPGLRFRRVATQAAVQTQDRLPPGPSDQAAA